MLIINKTLEIFFVKVYNKVSIYYYIPNAKTIYLRVKCLVWYWTLLRDSVFMSDTNSPSCECIENYLSKEIICFEHKPNAIMFLFHMDAMTGLLALGDYLYRYTSISIWILKKLTLVIYFSLQFQYYSKYNYKYSIYI